MFLTFHVWLRLTVSQLLLNQHDDDENALHQTPLRYDAPQTP